MTDDTQCKVCQQWFANAQLCMQHKDDMRHYQGFEALYPCGFCNCHFESFDALAQHKEDTGHWPKRSNCDKKDMSIDKQSAVNQQWFTAPQAGEQHKDNVTAHEVYMRTFECHSCESRFDTLEACYQHEDALGHGSKPFPCGICYRSFRFPRDVDKHIEDDHPKFKCETCPETFHTQDERDKHQRAPGHYHRSICSTYLSRPNKLQQHLEGHETGSHQRKFSIVRVDGNSCPFCHDTFTNVHQLLRHIELSRCDWEPGLNRDKIWQHYRKCDPQGVFTEPPDSQYDKEQGDIVLAWVDTATRNGARFRCCVCHHLFKEKHTLREHIIMNHAGQKEMYHCPKRVECRQGKTPFGSLQAFFRHLGSKGCASLNLHTVLCTVTSSEWPPDTAKQQMLQQMLSSLKN